MTHKLKQFVARGVSQFLYILLVPLSALLRKCSTEKWQKLVAKTLRCPAKFEGVDKPQFEIAPYKPIKTIGLESLTQQASTVDAAQRKVFQLPAARWTEEIPTFLMNQLSAHTRRAYETDLKQFLQFMKGQFQITNPSLVGPEHIVLYRKNLEEGRIHGRPLALTSINRKLAVVRSFFEWLKVNQILQNNPVSLVKGYPQSQESSLKGLSDEEARKILELPNRNTRAGNLHHAVLSLLLHLGLRKGELIGLKMGDLDEERGVNVVKVRGKGHRVRVLPLSAKVRADIERYFYACRRDKTDKEAPLFTPTKNPRSGVLSRPLNPHAITYMVIRYAKKAGVLKKVSPHSCRATCISHALDKRASHRSVQYLAGWSSPLMIQRYDKRREELQNSAAYLIDYGENQEVSSG